ncbi:MAG: PAS domain-containing sensor histidine kinase [Cytophagales bacterium]|nr:MAG: PAS domain-containing sensor histidine kinase [Cytophagales bacterium]
MNLAVTAEQQQIDYYEQILNSVAISIITLAPQRDESGMIVDFEYKAVNRQWEIDNQKSASEVLGQRVAEIYPAFVHSPTYKLFFELAETGTPIQTTDFFDLDGRTVKFDIRGVRTGNDIVLSVNDITLFWQAQAELEQQRQLLLSVLDGSQNQIIAFDSIRDAEGKIVDFRYVLQNAANRRTVDRTDEQVIGHTMLEYFPHVIETGLFDRYVQVIETGQSDRFDMPYYHDDLAGYYDISVVKRGDGMVLTLQNKTENWLADQRALQQADLLQRVVDNSPTGIILAEAMRNGEGEIVDFQYQLTNALNAEITGHTVDEMIGKPIGDLFPGWQSIPLFETFKQVTQTGESQRFPFEYDRYGVKGWFEGSFIKQGDGVLFTFLDVTSLKQAELDQEIQAQRLKAILDNSQTAISLHEAIRNEQGELVDFKTVLANRLALEQWGPLADQILNNPYSQISPNPNAAVEFARFKHVIETGETTIFEFNYEQNWHLMAIAKMGDGLVISFINITQIHQYREQLEATNQELKRSNEGLQQFAYVASHDLQEPLRKIMAFGDMLTDLHSASLGANGADLVSRMQQSAKRMSQLIRDLLNYSRISAQKDLFEPVDLNTLLTDVQGDLEVRIKDSGAVFSIDTLPTIAGSPVQLQQLFQNLLSNAIKFSHKDQSPVVTVRCCRANPHQMPTDLPIDRSYWQLTIQDNGIGFDEQYAERIFQVFQRLHGKAQFAGTGVGLAICRKVVENHSGAIRANSQPGEGATFTVWLPA